MIRDLADALVYSIVIGSIAVAIASGALWLLTAGQRGLLDLYGLGLGGLLNVSPTPTAIAVATYVVFSLVLAEIVGVMRIGAVVRAKLLDRFGAPFTEEPIWWEVFEARPKILGAAGVRANVRLKDGSVYAGTLHSFPIVRDEVRDKDSP